MRNKHEQRLDDAISRLLASPAGALETPPEDDEFWPLLPLGAWLRELPLPGPSAESRALGFSVLRDTAARWEARGTTGTASLFGRQFTRSSRVLLLAAVLLIALSAVTAFAAFDVGGFGSRVKDAVRRDTGFRGAVSEVSKTEELQGTVVRVGDGEFDLEAGDRVVLVILPPDVSITWPDSATPYQLDVGDSVSVTVVDATESSLRAIAVRVLDVPTATATVSGDVTNTATPGNPPTTTPSPATPPATVTPGPTEPVATATDEPEPTRTDRPEPTETDRPEPTETDEPEPTETDRPEPTETDRPEPTETDRPEPTETDRPEPTETDRPEPTETDRPEPTETDSPESDGQPWAPDDAFLMTAGISGIPTTP